MSIFFQYQRLLCLSVLLLSVGGFVFAQDSEAPAAKPAAPARDLSATELQLLRDYERFEKSLFDVGEQLRRKDPERAELLYRARTQSQEQNILAEMQTIAELLRSKSPTGAPVDPQFGPAADREKEVLARMKSVLRLLQSQDERERVAAEIARIQELLKDTNRIIARQKDVRADTQRSKDTGKNQEAQERVADEARKLSEKIDKQDAERQAKDASQKPTDGKQAPTDQKPEQGQDSKEGDDSKEGKSPSEKPSSGDSKPSEKPGENQPKDQKDSGDPSEGESQGEPQSGKPEQGEKSPGNPSPQQPSEDSESKQASPDSQKTPGREQLEQARREMQQAIEKLQQKQKEKAVEDQDEAVNRLEELKAQLEEILRQLREDERESYLTMLEARFQNMLRRQQHVNSETIRLDRIEVADRGQQNYASQSDNIRKEQEDNALEAEKSLHLLKEEGSSVAFPEAVQQMHQNMLLVAARLSRQETGQTTQVVEKMIVDTLEEMIAALRQELQKKQEEQQQGPQGGQGQPQEPGLINQLAELKLIRSLQNQINVLTRQIGTEVVNGAQSTPDQLQLIQDLKVRQERIQEATYDLSVGRNQ
ncbi:hypothetical protein SH661x_000463 [Planctomicrobium sp. SH661]|uniref:hypothetical protein n=1 Tax=Planctomicrobium sp. SH661 TaxID=3448124 RepID=UPI003F5B7E97